MDIVRVGVVVVVYSWTTGPRRVSSRETSLREEARTAPYAVLSRLIREGREAEAEELFEELTR